MEDKKYQVMGWWTNSKTRRSKLIWVYRPCLNSKKEHFIIRDSSKEWFDHITCRSAKQTRVCTVICNFRWGWLSSRYFQHIYARRILDFRHPKCQVVSYHQCFPKVSFHDWPLCPPLVRFLKSWLKVVYASSKAHQDKNGDHQIHWHKPIQEMRHDC